MKQKLGTPPTSRRLKATVLPSQQRWRTATPWWPGRQSPVAPNRPAPSNSHTLKACSILRQKPQERRGKTAPLLSTGQPFGPATPKDLGVLVTPFHLLLGNAPIHSIKHSPQYLPLNTNLSHRLLIPLPMWHLDPWPHPNGNTPPPARPHPLLNWKPPQEWPPEEPPHSKRRDEMPLHKVLTEGWCEAFARDSELVWKAREEHYKTNHPHFNHKTSHNLMNIFQNMITSAILLGSQIYEIQESWEGQSKLHYANDALRALPKGLWFFHAVSPSELPKVMGLAGVHNPDALCCFSGMTFCPWCGKEGQNKGTIVNHLQMTPLQARTSLWDMHPLSHSDLRNHLAPWPEKLSASPRGRWRPWWHIFICLAISRVLQTVCLSATYIDYFYTSSLFYTSS